MAEQDYEILDERFKRCVRTSAKVDRLYTGCRWTEGPAYFPAMRSLLFSDIPNDRMLRFDEESEAVSVFRRPADYTNGNTVDRQGRLVSCQHGARRVVRTEHDGSTTVLADRYQGKRFNSPNDVVVRSDGSIWFTDPSYGIDSNYEGYLAPSELGERRVYRIDPGSGAVAIVADGFAQPNGLAFSVNERRLFIADSGQPHGVIRVFDVRDDLQLRGGDVFATCAAGIYDGFRVDVDDRLWTSAGESIHCYEPDGALIGRILIPERVANLTFGGHRHNRLFITATSSLYSVLIAVCGAKTSERPASMSIRTFRQAMERGVEAHQAGRFDEALACYRSALEVTPDDAEALSLAGLALVHLAQTEQALSLLRRAVELEPNQSGFRLNLAEGLAQANQHDRALHELQIVTAAAPANARAWERAGDQSALLGDEAGAVGAWKRAYSLAPSAAPLAAKLARATSARRDWGALQAIAAAWTSAHPASDQAWRVAARAAFEQGRHVAAASAFARVLQLAPPTVADLTVYASLCLHALDIDAATAALDRAEALEADCAETLATRALLLMYLGRFADAEAYCRRCMERDPQHAPAYTTLSRLRRGHLPDADLSAVASIAQREDTDLDRRIPAAFAVAHAYDARDDVDAAFAAYEQAHALALERDRLENRRYEAAQIDECRARILKLSSALTHEVARNEGLPCPIFVVGMPRSGTTLIESVLGAHSRVFACGERAPMRQILQAHLDHDASGRTVEARVLREWSRAYFTDLRAPAGAEHVTDKHPLNFEAAALIARLFPNAVIIHVRRKPIETGLSIYRQEFSKHWTFAHRLEDIGHYYGHYARLVAHWERVLPDRFTTIQYERFVGDFEKAAPELVRACGLQWEPQCLNFQQTPRAIATFSTVQARDAVRLGESRAERYEKYLAPLAAALERAGVDSETGALRA